jgi:F-type H+-transporting ATPase subunit epsilon
MSFTVTIVTPEQQVLDETVRSAVLPAHDGQIGILTDRAPLLVKLGAGRLQIELAQGGQGGQGGTTTFFVEGGVAQMKDNKLTVLTNEAIPADQINLESARAEYAEAAARVATDEKTAADRTRSMQRARAMQDLAAARR